MRVKECPITNPSDIKGQKQELMKYSRRVSSSHTMNTGVMGGGGLALREGAWENLSDIPGIGLQKDNRLQGGWEFEDEKYCLPVS